jgi:hypothetical protein
MLRHVDENILIHTSASYINFPLYAGKSDVEVAIGFGTP